MIDCLFRKKSTALGYQEERFPQSNVNAASPTQVPSLSDGFADIMSAWAFCTERFQANEEESVFLGSDLIEWMVREGKCETEIEAQVKAAAMVSRGLFLPARDKRTSSYFEPDFYYTVNKVLDFGDDKPKVYSMVTFSSLIPSVELSAIFLLIMSMHI
jgi:hypothetical protein